jgi:hypothetical protein
MTAAGLCTEPGSLMVVEQFLQDNLSSATIEVLMRSPSAQLTELLRRVYVGGRFWVSIRKRAARRGLPNLSRGYAPLELRMGTSTLEHTKRLLLYADTFPVNDPLFAIAAYLAEQTGYDPTDLQGIRVSHARAVVTNFDQVLADALSLLGVLRPLSALAKSSSSQPMLPCIGPLSTTRREDFPAMTSRNPMTRSRSQPRFR